MFLSVFYQIILFRIDPSLTKKKGSAIFLLLKFFFSFSGKTPKYSCKINITKHLKLLYTLC